MLLYILLYGKMNQLKEKDNSLDPDAGKDWEQKWMTEDKMVGWHHWLNEYEFEQAPGDGEQLECLVCFYPWSDRVWQGWVTEQQL